METQWLWTIHPKGRSQNEEKKNLLRNKREGWRTNVPLKWKGIYIYKTRGWDGREKFKKRMKNKFNGKYHNEI